MQEIYKLADVLREPLNCQCHRACDDASQGCCPTGHAHRQATKHKAWIRCLSDWQSNSVEVEIKAAAFIIPLLNQGHNQALSHTGTLNISPGHRL